MKTIFFLSILFYSQLNAFSAVKQTFILSEPLIVHFTAYVPAVKAGPFINRSCRARIGCTVNSTLPAIVNHSKSNGCTNGAGRILAESVWAYNKDAIPLTIFNGWQWQYQYDMCQFKNNSYNLKRRTGSWEIAMEAEISLTFAENSSNWLSMNEASNFSYKRTGQSKIEILNFSNLRTRNGYPKSRKLRCNLGNGQ